MVDLKLRSQENQKQVCVQEYNLVNFQGLGLYFL